MVTGQLQDKAENLLQLYWLKNSNPEILHIALKKISCTHFLSQLIKDDEVKITYANLFYANYKDLYLPLFIRFS